MTIQTRRGLAAGIALLAGGLLALYSLDLAPGRPVLSLLALSVLLEAAGVITLVRRGSTATEAEGQDGTVGISHPSEFPDTRLPPRP